MRRRIYLTIAMTLSLVSVSIATFVGVQKATSNRPAPSARRGAAQGAAGRGAGAQRAPLRKPDPDRAPQPAVDEALFTNEEFFGVTASVERPYQDALARITALETSYPKDARLRLHAARLAEHTGQFDKAASEMTSYAALKGRSPESLRRLADFYHDRARFADEVKTLRDLAQALPVAERGPIYKRAADLARSRSLKEFKPSDFFAELVAADPTNVQPVKDYVEELLLAKQNSEALSVLASFQPKFPSELNYFLSTRARIFESTGDRRAAEEVYSTAFDPNWPQAITADYYDLLRRFGRYRTIRRQLQESVRGGATDLQTVSRLFRIYAYEGNYEQAAQTLRDLEARRAGGGSTQGQSTQGQGTQGQGTQGQGAQPPPVSASVWNARELETAAGLFTSIGHYDQASRYLYTLYLVGGLQSGSNTREEALYRLFKVMLDAAGTPTRFGAGDLSFYKDVAEIDQHPGFMNGVLSLILSGTDPAQEFANQEKAAAGYFNRAFAYRIFTSFKQEYAASKHLGEMYLGVVNIFSALGEHRLAIEAGREFQERFPNAPEYSAVSLRIADSYVALKDRKNERAVLMSLLDRLARTRPKGTSLVPVSAKRWSLANSPQFRQLLDRIKYNLEAYSDTYDPTEGGISFQNYNSYDEEEEESSSSASVDGNSLQGPSYGEVLERYVASLASEEKKTETLAFFWGEIKKHPREEGLYERFLSWLGQAQLVNEQLKAYDSAIRQFDSNTWYHRLARWYVREKRGRELARYSRDLINIFDEPEITEYLVRFAGYGATSTGDQLNWDGRLAFDLYSVAHQRFPRNLFFVRGMLTYLSTHDTTAWAKLSAQYYFADRSIRDPYLQWLSYEGELRARYSEAKSKTTGNATTPGSQPSALGPYNVFAADAALWLSHHDEAIEAYRNLVALYPGEPQYADRLADLTRSFGSQDDKYYEESARTFAQMADIYPSDHSYRIKAGEVYAQLGDFNRAAEEWNKLIKLEPAERETYLEVATVFWDYYQFDQAISVFKQLRDVTGDPTIYAYRMGAVYEGKDDIDSAITEYVKVLNEPGDGRNTVAERLAQLARRTGLAEKISAAYQSAHSAHPDDWQLVIGYASYLAERDKQADALALLRSEIERSSDVAYLESVRDLFRIILRPEDERMVITRLASVARDEREAMMYRLQLASFLERHNQKDQAIGVIDSLVADYPTNVGVVEESAQFYWRAGLTDRALDLYKKTLARALGSNQRNLTLQLAKRQADAGKLADSEATLRTYYASHPLDSEVFAMLAKTLGAENKLEDLATLYRDAFKEVKESDLSRDESKSRVADLREGMIRTLDSLKKYEEAVDQYIEIINTFPEDADRLATAIDYAEAHNLSGRLDAYYEKLAKEAYKNYRWQLVLGRIYERRGNLAGATDQYRGAVANEPQRSDLRFSLASTLARQQRYDEAIAVLREGWSLSGRDPQWLIEVARIQVQQGKRDEAAQTVRQALASKKDAKPEDGLQAASRLASWGLYPAAVQVYEEIIAQIPKTLKDDYVGTDFVVGYINALVHVEPPVTVFQKLERMRAQYQAIFDNSDDNDKYRASSIVSAIDQAMRADFGRGVIDYASATETTALVGAVQAATAKLTAYSDKDALLRYLGIARGANLVEVEEQIYIQIKDAALKGHLTATDTEYYNEMRALVAFYNRHAAFVRAAEALADGYARDKYKDHFDYQNQIAIEYRLSGDTNRELEWLRSAYRSASGDLTASSADWVDRYLTLLYSTGKRDEVQQIASSYNPYQLQLINFLIEKGEKDIARKAIASARQSPAWVASRSGEVGLFLKDTSVETEAFFKAALDIRPIGEMLGRRVDSNQTLLGNDWFTAARNYGYWLGLVPSRGMEGQHYVPAEIENHPSSARAQLELAAYFLDQKDLDRATDHTGLASELAPGSKEIALMRGSIALARGDRQAAQDAWATIITGRVSVDDAQTYLKVMADNGFLREALPRLQAFLVSYVNRRVRNQNASERIEAIKPLVRDITARAQGNEQLEDEIGTYFHNVINSMPGDTSIGSLLIEENLLPDSALGGLYRTIHQRLSDQAAAVFGTDEYDNGYYNGSEYVYPAQALSEFRRRFLDYLIKSRAFDEARLLVATINQEQADLALATKADDYVVSRYDWLPLASALIELRGGDAAKAVAELRRYCGLDGGETNDSDEMQSSGSGLLHEQCLKAYALLLAEGKDTEAEAMLYEAYRAAARTRYSDDASLAGLAEIEARRGQMDEAGRLLKLLVERSTDNLKALRLAAETSARINRFDDAVNFREQIARINPNDATNKLELAHVIAAAGRNGEAVDRIIALIAERTTSNSVRAQAAEIMGEIARRDPSQGARAAAALDGRVAQADAGAVLARAAIAEKTGRPDEARQLLKRITGGSLASVAQMKLGIIEKAAGQDAEAVASFERAIYLDADGDMTGAIAFVAPGPRAQLIALYSRAGRDLAAIRLAESDDASGPAAINAAIKNALNGGEQAERTSGSTVAFEPSLEITRSKAPGLRTLAEANDAALSRTQSEEVSALVDSAARLGQYDRAIAMERLLALEATKPDEKTGIEKRLAEIMAAKRAEQIRSALLLRVDNSNATESIYAGRLLGEK